jgi:beta-galactosidase
MKDVFASYENMNFDGIPLGFATDSIIYESDINDFDVILIWKTESVTRQELYAMQAYLDSGGTIIMDANSFKVNEYGTQHPGLIPGMGTIYLANSLSEMRSRALQILSEKGFAPEVTVTETNSIGPRGCMWRCIKNQAGNNVISLVNLGKSNANLNIELPAAEHGTAARDLINGIGVSPDTVLAPYGILFLELTEKEQEPVDTTTSAQQINSDLENLAKLYPNPSSGKFCIDFSKTHDNLHLEVYNLSGNKLSSTHYYGVDKISHRICNQPDGVYLIRVQSAEGVQNFVFSKQYPN